MEFGTHLNARFLLRQFSKQKKMAACLGWRMKMGNFTSAVPRFCYPGAQPKHCFMTKQAELHFFYVFVSISQWYKTKDLLAFSEILVCPVFSLTTPWTLPCIDSTRFCSESTLSQHSVRVFHMVAGDVTVWSAVSPGDNHRGEVFHVALPALA